MLNDNTAFWKPGPYVWTGTVPGQLSSVAEYPIRRDGAATVGMIVCFTSAVTLSTAETSPGVPDPRQNVHSACGKVLKVSSTLCEPEGGIPIDIVCVRHLDETNITTAVQGASGGPVYKAHSAYGLVVAENMLTHHMFFEGIRGAEAALHVKLVLAPPA